MAQLSRKQWYEVLNTRVLKVLGEKSEMMLTEVRDILDQDDSLAKDYRSTIGTHWDFTDFYDRFANNIKNCKDVSIEKKGSRVYIIKNN